MPAVSLRLGQRPVAAELRSEGRRARGADPAGGGRGGAACGVPERRPRRSDADRGAAPRRLSRVPWTSRPHRWCDALRTAPPRRPARPHPAARWRAVEVDDAVGMIRRPPGLELDLGGSVKGWAADLVATRLARDGRFAVDCGGDLRVAAGRGAPWEVRVRHPLTGAIARTFRVRAGGVATSGIDARLWERDGGRRPPPDRPRHRDFPPGRGWSRRRRSLPPRSRPRRSPRPRCCQVRRRGAAPCPPRRRARPRRRRRRCRHLKVS